MSDRTPGELADLEKAGSDTELAALTADLENVLRPAAGDELAEAAAEDAERPTLAEQLRARGAEQAARDAEDDAAAAERAAREAEEEYIDYEEASAVREIRREMAIEAGDDSELDRQIAEDDARNERAWEAGR